MRTISKVVACSSFMMLSLSNLLGAIPSEFKGTWRGIVGYDSDETSSLFPESAGLGKPGKFKAMPLTFQVREGIISTVLGSKMQKGGKSY